MKQTLSQDTQTDRGNEPPWNDLCYVCAHCGCEKCTLIVENPSIPVIAPVRTPVQQDGILGEAFAVLVLTLLLASIGTGPVLGLAALVDILLNRLFH